MARHPARLAPRAATAGLRNTLGYRLRELESLLGLRLDTIKGQTTSLLALRIYE